MNCSLCKTSLDSYCGHRSCFENLWSGSALHHRAKALGFQDFNDLYETNGSFTAFVPSYEILQADPDKNPALVGAMRLFAETI